MILADTNCLLLIAGIDDNSEIDKNKFDIFVSKKELCISTVSIFELLNNPKIKDNYSFIIKTVISKNRKTHFLNTTFFNSYFSPDILYDLECKNIEEQKRVKNEISKAIVDVFSFYYSNLLTCAVSAYFIVFNNFDDINRMDDEYFKKQIQCNYDLLEPKLRLFLSSQFKMMVLNYCFNEKTRKKIIESLYFILIKNYSKVYNKTYFDLEKNGVISYETLFLRMKSVTKKMDITKICSYKETISFKDISLFESLTKQLNDTDEKKKMKDYLIKIAITLAKRDYRISPYLNKLFELNLCSLLFEKAKFNDNDILDSLILDIICYNSNVPFEGILTLDKKMISKARICYPNLKVFGKDLFKKDD